MTGNRRGGALAGASLTAIVQTSAVSLFKSASTVSLFTLPSLITGLVREVLITSLFGASAMTDSFNVAFHIPNLFGRLFGRLFAEGAFSQTFGSMLAANKAQHGDTATKLIAWVLERISCTVQCRLHATDSHPRAHAPDLADRCLGKRRVQIARRQGSQVAHLGLFHGINARPALSSLGNELGQCLGGANANANSGRDPAHSKMRSRTLRLCAVRPSHTPAKSMKLSSML